jgi:hypothetical protein
MKCVFCMPLEPQWSDCVCVWVFWCSYTVNRRVLHQLLPLNGRLLQG